jgi:hypothetical protein
MVGHFPIYREDLWQIVEWLDALPKKPAKLRICPKCEEAGITACALARR